MGKETILCKTYCWVPNLFPYAPQILKNHDPIVTRASQLFDYRSNSWNEIVVHQNFHPKDANHILSIPIGFHRGDDKIVWHHNNHRAYTVKSGYYFTTSILMSSQDGNRAGLGP